MKGAWNIVFVLVVASLIMGVIQLAIMVLIVWGLLFRTRETIGMLLFFFILGLISRHPWTGVTMLVSLVALTLLQRCNRGKTNLRPRAPGRVDRVVEEDR